MRDVSSDFWQVVLISIAAFAVLALAVKQVVFRLVSDDDVLPSRPANDGPARLALPPGPSPATESSGSHVADAMQVEDVRCSACGDVASEPMPCIERSRGAHDWLRELFAMPPRYRRVVRNIAPALCRSHAHVADAMVDEFLHNRVRGAFAAAYTRVAVEAAGFEKEFLMKQLSESLTDDQKRAAKRAGGTVTRLLKTAEG